MGFFLSDVRQKINFPWYRAVRLNMHNFVLCVRDLEKPMYQLLSETGYVVKNDADTKIPERPMKRASYMQSDGSLKCLHNR